MYRFWISIGPLIMVAVLLVVLNPKLITDYAYFLIGMFVLGMLIMGIFFFFTKGSGS